MAGYVLLDSFRSSILSDVVKLTSTLLLVLMLTAPASAGPPQRPDFPQGVSTTNPGNDLWSEVRQRGLPVTGSSQVKGVDSGVLINVEGNRWARFRVDNPVRHARCRAAWCIALPITSESCTGAWL